MKLKMVCLLLYTCVFMSMREARGAENLMVNGACDGPAGEKLPPHWRPLVISTPATFATDVNEKHGGQSSLRITAAESTRSYAQSEEIEVAPGETIHGSAWVKVKDVPEKDGANHVIMIAHFSSSDGSNETVMKFDVAKFPDAAKGWQKIQGSVKVPDLMTKLSVRVGFSYCWGTCWWDDVTITAESPLAIRIDQSEARLTPAMEGMPLAILNRDGRRGAARVRLSLNKQHAEQKLELNGEPMQRIELPIQLPPPGKVAAKAELLAETGEKTVFVEERKAFVPTPIALGVPSPTHWVLEDGDATIEGTVDLAVPAKMLDKSSVAVRLEDRAGKVVKNIEIAPGLKDGIQSFTLKAGSLPVGDYSIVAEINGTRAKPQEWHVIPRRLAKVTINSSGYPVYDGKAIFPMGIFNGGKFKEQGEAGFTVTHAYNAVRLEEDSRDADENALRFIENSDANGMKMLFMVPMKAAIAGEWELVRRRIRMFRNHPGLLAWDEEEGFARGDFKPDTLKMIRKIIDEEDPNHPLMVGDSRDVIGRARGRADFFPDEMDLGMWWWYPFPLKTGAADALEGEEAGKADELEMPTFLTNTATKKPIWLGIQSYKKKDSRYPTPAEYRSQAYLAVIRGAKGFMWYGGSVTGGMFTTKPSEAHWDDLKGLVKELRSLHEVFMSPSLPGAKADQPLVDVCVKKSGERVVLIAASRSGKPLDATITAEQIRGGPIKEHFAPLDVHVHELSK